MPKGQAAPGDEGEDGEEGGRGGRMLLYNSRRLTPPTSSGAGGREAGGLNGERPDSDRGRTRQTDALEIGRARAASRVPAATARRATATVPSSLPSPLLHDLVLVSLLAFSPSRRPYPSVLLLFRIFAVEAWT